MDKYLFGERLRGIMENEYKTWKTKPSEDNFNSLMKKAKPTINSALSLYVGGDDSAARSKARVLTSRAIKQYDPNKGTKLKTHLMTQLQPLRRYAAKRRTLTHIPEEAQRDKSILNDARINLEDNLDREPSDAELADFTGFNMKRLQSLRNRQLASPESTLAETYQPSVSAPGSNDAWTDYVYYDLPNMDRKILEWKTGYGGHKIRSTNEIARSLKMTPAAISQRVNKIMKKLEEGMDYVN